jgi:tRNA-splicing ligase RtcB (3'-phosphate/5'-hydroxy nucleic acid ligase)
MPERVGNVLSWGSDLEKETIEQAAKASRLPFVTGHLALMPDAHVGMGATIGSVIPTQGAIIPSAVGVDIGCGMIAAETNLTADHLPDDFERFLGHVEQVVPAGVGKGHTFANHSERRQRTLEAPPYTGASTLTGKQVSKITDQFGSLGSGNHFVEVCLDERDRLWVVLHSGSRGIGNQLATQNIEAAKGLMKKMFISLEDPDLAYLVEDTPEFDAYIADMLWAQEYARTNRETMMDAVLSELWGFLDTSTSDSDPGHEVRRINCHHNYTERERHHGRNVWLTRKGAIRARQGDFGVIPGSMGTSSYIVRGLGNPTSYESCSHGAGRRMSRSRARQEIALEDFVASMGDRDWQVGKADQLLDEALQAYKDIDQVMADQADLVTVEHTLHQILNYKGTT